jgi:hypothetical protein
MTTTYNTNLTTGATSRYENFDFNSMCLAHDGKHYGLTATGLCELSGALDEAASIESMIGLGNQNFGSSELQRIPWVYLSVACETKMLLRVRARGLYYEFLTRGYDEELQQQRVDVAQGLKANFFGIDVYNTDGGDFTLASIGIEPIKSKRKIRS